MLGGSDFQTDIQEHSMVSIYNILHFIFYRLEAVVLWCAVVKNYI